MHKLLEYHTHQSAIKMRRPLVPLNRFGGRPVSVAITVADVIHQSVTVEKALVLLQQLLLRLNANLDHI